MRKLFIVIAAMLLSVVTFAQAPQGFSYQAVVRDAQNAIVANQTVDVTVTILQGAAFESAKAVFSEKHSAKTNANGLFTITIGSVNTSDFAKIDWGKGSCFLKTESTYGESTTQLMSVPYALYAANAGTVDNATIEQFVSNIDFTTYNLVNKTSLAQYAKSADVTNTVNNALASYTTNQKLNDTLAVYAKIVDLPEGVNLTGYAKTDDLADVATTGSYNDLTNKPTIPTTVSQLTDAGNYLTTNTAASTYATQSSLKTVATTGSYNDLTDRPTKVSDLTADKIGDMPMATVDVTVTTQDDVVATASFLGRELTSGTTRFKVPAYSPVFLSVSLSKYSEGRREYSYQVKINGETFDPVAGYYYAFYPMQIQNLQIAGGLQNGTPGDYYGTFSGSGLRMVKTQIYKDGSGKRMELPAYMYKSNFTEGHAPVVTDAERNMVNQIVGPFPNAVNTIEITVGHIDITN